MRTCLHRNGLALRWQRKSTQKSAHVLLKCNTQHEQLVPPKTGAAQFVGGRCWQCWQQGAVTTGRNHQRCRWQGGGVLQVTIGSCPQKLAAAVAAAAGGQWRLPTEADVGVGSSQSWGLASVTGNKFEESGSNLS